LSSPATHTMTTIQHFLGNSVNSLGKHQKTCVALLQGFLNYVWEDRLCLLSNPLQYDKNVKYDFF
jgi:hypothetical protein